MKKNGNYSYPRNSKCYTSYLYQLAILSRQFLFKHIPDMDSVSETFLAKSSVLKIARGGGGQGGCFSKSAQHVIVAL